MNQENTIIEYYGTLLDQAGHGFHILNNGFNRSTTRLEYLPFNPEGLPFLSRGRNYANGTVRFYNAFGFTICAIAGSPYDKRNGSKSIFFIQEDLTREVFEQKLKSNETVKKIIAKMPFNVLW